MEQKYNKAYKFRLKPNKQQEALIVKTFGCVRFIWNQLLNYADKYYKDNGKKGYTTPAKFKEKHEWLKEVDSLALANVQMNLKKLMMVFSTKYQNFQSIKVKKIVSKVIPQIIK